MAKVTEQPPATLSWEIEGKTHVFTMTSDEITLGRKLDCDLVLAHRSVSQLHATLFWEKGNFYIKDLDSSYGTRLGAQQLKPNIPHPVVSGDTFTVGRQMVTFGLPLAKEPPQDIQTLELTYSNKELTREVDKIRTAISQQCDRHGGSAALKDSLAGELEGFNDFLETRFKEYEVLQEITQIIVGILDLRELLSTVLKLASRVLNADRGFILLYDATRNDLRSMVTRHFERQDGQALDHDFNFSQTIARSCFEKREPVIIDDALQHEQFASSHSIVASSIRSVVCLPLIKGQDVSGVLYLDNLSTPGCFSTHQLSFLKAFAAQTALALDNARLYTQAVTDGLTQLYNRKFVDERIAEEMVRSHRYGRDCSVILLDVDHFKQVNDTYGHHAGDVVLQRLANCLQEQARSSDIVARYGGEEFIMLLTETDDKGARIFADRLRKAVEALDIQADAQKISITISCGISTYRRDFRSSVKAFVNEADQGLYRAKQTGRNRVCHMLDGL